MEGIVVDGLETGVCEAEDYGQDGTCDVTEDGSPDEGKGPVLGAAAAADDRVEVVTELVALGLILGYDQWVTMDYSWEAY